MLNEVGDRAARQRGVCCEVVLPLTATEADQAANLVKSLADSTRLQIVAVLWRTDAPVCICDLTGALRLTQPTVSHHMAKLKAAGLVDATKQGIWIYYRLRRDLPPAVTRLVQAAVHLAEQESADGGRERRRAPAARAEAHSYSSRAAEAR